MSEPMYTIKPLEWNLVISNEWGERFQADTPIGDYAAWSNLPSGRWSAAFGDNAIGYDMDSLPSAQFAAFAHYIARMREGLEEVKVLGTLPVTRDGAVTPQGVEVFHPDHDSRSHALIVTRVSEAIDDFEGYGDLYEGCEWVGAYSYYERDTGYGESAVYDLRECYSTREAAEAARKPPHIGHAGESFPIVPSMMKPASDAGRKGGV